jgi:hypothetical protein
MRLELDIEVKIVADQAEMVAESDPCLEDTTCVESGIDRAPADKLSDEFLDAVRTRDPRLIWTDPAGKQINAPSPPEQ